MALGGKCSWSRRMIWVGLAVYAALLCVYSVIPATPGMGLLGVLLGRDLVAHGLAYAGLAILLCFALPGGNLSALVTIALAALLSLAFGGLMELIQVFVPWRSFSFADLGADTMGVLFAIGTWALLHRIAVGARAAPAERQVKNGVRL